MKKFLFTLATLLMAGSMFAGENYFYMDNITLTKEEAANGCFKVVNVKAHFDEAVSAWQADFILPEGVTIGTQAKGADLTLTFLGQFENEETLETYYQETTYSPDFGTNATKTRVIVNVGTTKEYDETGHGYGVCWRSGNYEQMWRVRLEFPAGFKGGDIVLHSEASCSKGIMPGLTPCELSPIDKTTEVRIKADKPEIAVTGDDYTKTVTITAEEDATIYYSTDGVSYQVYTAPIEFNEEGTYKVYAYAEGPGEGVERKSKSDVAESDEFTIIAQEQLQPAPKPTITDDGTKVTAAIAGDTQHTYVLELWNAETETWGEVANPYTLPAATFETQVLKFRAKTKAIEGVDSEDSPYSAEYTVTIDPKADNQAPKPTFRVEDGKLYAESAEGLAVVMMKDGTVCDNPYTLPTENTSYTDDIVLNFTAYAKADGVTYNLNSDNAEYPFVLPHLNKKTAQKPTIERGNMTDATCDIVITPDPNTDGTLEYTANPAAPGKAQTLTYERKDAEYTVHVEAWTNAGETYLASEVAKADIVIPAKPAPEVIELPDPTISETHDAANQTTIITITVPENTPEGTVLNYTLTDEDGYVIPASDYTVTATDGKIVITIPNGAETAFVTVTATTTMPNAPEGVVVENGEATKTVEVPQYQQTAAPTIDVSFGGEDGAHYANVTFVNNDAKPATIEYSLDNGETWLPYTGAPVVITTYGETTVLARATAEGKATSEVAERSFMLNDDATGVNELVNGKTVAGVRYFNMAGQEMQEANGITIVVTTYTDGTTSAVKVIK